jgi:hypothetical protein
MPEKRPFIREMIAEAIDSFDGVVSNTEIRNYIHSKWDDVKDQSINAHILLLTVNTDSRTNWPENQKARTSNDSRYDLLFSTGRGTVIKYNPEQHGLWEIYEVDLGKYAVRKLNDTDMISEALKSYKEFIRSSHLDDEVYKWRAIKHFQDHWNADAEDFGVMFEEAIKHQFNLMSQWSFSSLKYFCREKSEGFKEAILNLYNQDIPIEERIVEFQERSKQLALDHPQGWSDSQDERAISVYLTFRYPEDYIHYKNSFYTQYCKLTGNKKAKTGSKFIHFQELAKKVKKEYIETDTELIDLVKSYIGPEEYSDSNNNLLTQDFFFYLENSTKEKDSPEHMNVDGEEELLFRLKKLPKETSEYYFNVLDKIRERLDVTPDDDRLVFSTKNDRDRLSFQIGQRYCWAVYSNQLFTFIVPKKVDVKGIDSTGDFADSTKWVDTPKQSIVDEHIDNIIAGCQDELSLISTSNFKRHDNKAFRKAVFDQEYRMMILNQLSYSESKPKTMTHPLNQILYGPPGTGKTFNTINESLSIVDPEFYQANHNNREVLQRRFNELLISNWEKLDGKRIAFCTFHQSLSYEDFIEGIKPIEPEKEGDSIVYKIEEGIFHKLCTEASFNIAQKKKSKETNQIIDFSITYDQFVQELEDLLATNDIVEFETKNGGKVLVDSVSRMGNIIIKHRGGSRMYTISKTRLSKLDKEVEDLDDLNNINDQFREIIGGSNASAYWAILNGIRQKNYPQISNQEKRIYLWDDKKELIRTLSNDDYKELPGDKYSDDTLPVIPMIYCQF